MERGSGERMRSREGIPVHARSISASVLGLLALSLILTACGRIPESEAAKSRLPTETPTAAARAQAGGAGGGFKVAETPPGNATAGQNLYLRSCQACHGNGGVTNDPAQKSLLGNGGLIPAKNLDTTEKFVNGFMANAAHASFKDDPNQDLTPARLSNVYAYLISQLTG